MEELVPETQFFAQVSQIEPGNYIAGTKILTEEKIQEASNEMWENMSDQVKSDYGENYFEERVAIMKSYMGTGCSDQSPVIDAVTNALSDAFPQKRYQVGTMAEQGGRVRRVNSTLFAKIRVS